MPCTSATRSASGNSTKQGFEKVAERTSLTAESSALAASSSSEDFAEIDVALPVRRGSEIGTALPVCSERIVFRSLIRIAEYFVSFLDFLKAILGLFVIR